MKRPLSTPSSCSLVLIAFHFFASLFSVSILDRGVWVFFHRSFFGHSRSFGRQYSHRYSFILSQPYRYDNNNHHHHLGHLFSTRSRNRRFYLLHPHSLNNFPMFLHDLSHVRLPIRPYTNLVRYLLSDHAHETLTQRAIPLLLDWRFHHYRLLIQLIPIPCMKPFLSVLVVSPSITLCCTDATEEAWLIYRVIIFYLASKPVYPCSS